MPVRTVGPTSTYATIALAMLDALPGDTIALEDGYGGETATVDETGLIVTGDATNLGITLRLGSGVTTITVSGAAPINVRDAVTGESTQGNTIVSGGGNNVIMVSGGIDAVDGGLGTDRLVVNYASADGAVTGDSTSNFTDASGGRAVTITDGTFEHFTIRTGAFADTITTGSGNDRINVGDGANTVTAGGGANSIIGGSGADTFTALGGGNFMDGGNGANVLTSGAGRDTILSGTGADTIVSGGGADTITARGGADTVNAGAQGDRLIVDYSAMTTNVTGSVTGGSLGAGYTGQIADQVSNTVDFVGVEKFTITTGSGADIIRTGGGTDSIFGGGGADKLFGGAGTDRLHGGAGKDLLEGGAGNDIIRGGTNLDTASYASAAARVLVDLGRLDHWQDTGGAGVDYLSSVANLIGSGHADRLVGSDQGNRIDGRLGNDVVRGGGGGDALFGGAGTDALSGGGSDDRLWGGTGADRLIGGAGDDRLEGGAGADRFVFAALTGRDTISDFEDGLDRIDLSSLDLAFRDLDITYFDDRAVILVEDGTSIRLLGVTEGLDRADFIL